MKLDGVVLSAWGQPRQTRGESIEEHAVFHKYAREFIARATSRVAGLEYDVEQPGSVHPANQGSGDIHPPLDRVSCKVWGERVVLRNWHAHLD